MTSDEELHLYPVVPQEENKEKDDKHHYQCRAKARHNFFQLEAWIKLERDSFRLAGQVLITHLYRVNALVAFA